MLKYCVKASGGSSSSSRSSSSSSCSSSSSSSSSSGYGSSSSGGSSSCVVVVGGGGCCSISSDSKSSSSSSIYSSSNFNTRSSTSGRGGVGEGSSSSSSSVDGGGGCGSDHHLCSLFLFSRLQRLIKQQLKVTEEHIEGDKTASGMAEGVQQIPELKPIVLSAQSPGQSDIERIQSYVTRTESERRSAEEGGEHKMFVVQEVSRHSAAECPYIHGGKDHPPSRCDSRGCQDAESGKWHIVYVTREIHKHAASDCPHASGGVCPALSHDATASVTPDASRMTSLVQQDRAVKRLTKLRSPSRTSVTHDDAVDVYESYGIPRRFSVSNDDSRKTSESLDGSRRASVSSTADSPMKRASLDSSRGITLQNENSLKGRDNTTVKLESTQGSRKLSTPIEESETNPASSYDSPMPGADSLRTLESSDSPQTSTILLEDVFKPLRATSATRRASVASEAPQGCSTTDSAARRLSVPTGEVLNKQLPGNPHRPTTAKEDWDQQWMAIVDTLSKNTALEHPESRDPDPDPDPVPDTLTRKSPPASESRRASVVSAGTKRRRRKWVKKVTTATQTPTPGSGLDITSDESRLSQFTLLSKDELTTDTELESESEASDMSPVMQRSSDKRNICEEPANVVSESTQMTDVSEDESKSHDELERDRDTLRRSPVMNRSPEVLKRQNKPERAGTGITSSQIRESLKNLKQNVELQNERVKSHTSPMTNLSSVSAKRENELERENVASVDTPTTDASKDQPKTERELERKQEPSRGPPVTNKLHDALKPQNELESKKAALISPQMEQTLKAQTKTNLESEIMVNNFQTSTPTDESPKNLKKQNDKERTNVGIDRAQTIHASEDQANMGAELKIETEKPQSSPEVDRSKEQNDLEIAGEVSNRTQIPRASQEQRTTVVDLEKESEKSQLSPMTNRSPGAQKSQTELAITSTALGSTQLTDALNDRSKTATPLEKESGRSHHLPTSNRSPHDARISDAFKDQPKAELEKEQTTSDSLSCESNTGGETETKTETDSKNKAGEISANTDYCLQDSETNRETGNSEGTSKGVAIADQTFGYSEKVGESKAANTAPQSPARNDQTFVKQNTSSALGEENDAARGISTADPVGESKNGKEDRINEVSSSIEDPVIGGVTIADTPLHDETKTGTDEHETKTYTQDNETKTITHNDRRNNRINENERKMPTCGENRHTGTSEAETKRRTSDGSGKAHRDKDELRAPADEGNLKVQPVFEEEGVLSDRSTTRSCPAVLNADDEGPSEDGNTRNNVNKNDVLSELTNKREEVHSPFGSTTKRHGVETHLGSPTIRHEVDTSFGTPTKRHELETPFGSPFGRQEVNTPFGNTTKRHEVNTPFGSPSKRHEMGYPFSSPTKDRDVSEAMHIMPDSFKYQRFKFSDNFEKTDAPFRKSTDSQSVRSRNGWESAGEVSASPDERLHRREGMEDKGVSANDSLTSMASTKEATTLKVSNRFRLQLTTKRVTNALLVLVFLISCAVAVYFSNCLSA